MAEDTKTEKGGAQLQKMGDERRKKGDMVEREG